jgi:hypothetical protein
MTLRNLLLCSLLAAASACSSTQTGSCDQMISTGRVSYHECTEYSLTGATTDLLGTDKSNCVSSASGSPGTWSGSPCTHMNAIGGCQTSAGGAGSNVSITTWYYQGNPSSIDQLKASCPGGLSMWISP